MGQDLPTHLTLSAHDGPLLQDNGGISGTTNLKAVMIGFFVRVCAVKLCGYCYFYEFIDLYVNPLKMGHLKIYAVLLLLNTVKFIKLLALDGLNCIKL